MPIKAVFSDLDGTLLYPDGSYSKETVRAIESLSANKILFTGITGRSYREVRHIFNELQIRTPGVFNGGASIVDPVSGKVLQQTLLSKRQTIVTVEQIISLCKYVSFGSGKVKSADFTPSMVSDGCLSIWAECIPARVSDVVKVVKGIPGVVAHVNNIARDGKVGIQINHVDADKKHGALRLMQALGLLPSEVLAIGDDHNDLPLFEAVGTSVAMNSSPESLRLVADHVVADATAEGFAEAIEKYALTAE